MKRPLFVFAGQSNMMGAAVYSAKEQVCFENSFEYLHNPRRLGAEQGVFKSYGFPVGEFSYKDLTAAYGQGADVNAKSTLAHYTENTYFCPAMANLRDEEQKTCYPFSHFSEATASMGVSMAPYIVKGLEQKGYACAYTHIAKGGVPIRYYLEKAADYFAEKVTDFFDDCQTRFAGDDMSEKVLIWHQGESDRSKGEENYVQALDALWHRAKAMGFTKFFIVRVGYWGSDSVFDIMRAQERFCQMTPDAFIITRVASFMAWASEDGNREFRPDSNPEFAFCRDSFYGFENQHINQKGFEVIAKYAVPNMIRVLFQNTAPVLEEEAIPLLK